MQILAEICQNRTARKDEFFRKSYVAQIRKPKTIKSCIYSPGLRKKNSGHFDFYVILYDLNSGQQKSVSCAEIRIIVSTFHQRPYLAQQRHKRKDTAGLLRK